MKKKKSPITPKYDSGRETRVLLELMRSEIKTVAEGHSILLNGQEEIKSEVETVKQAVLENSGRLGRVETRFENVEKKLDANLANHEARIIRLEEKVGV